MRRQNFDRIENTVKILHLHTRAVIGGSSRETISILGGLPIDRFEGHLACGHEGDLTSFINSANKDHLTIHIIPHLFNRIHVINDLFAFFEIIKLIKKQHYRIVHTHNSKAGILGRFAAWVCGVPVIIHTIHSCPFNYDGVSWGMRYFFILCEKLASLVTDHFIAISDHLKEEFAIRGIAPLRKISVIYSGIPVTEFKKKVNVSEKKLSLGIPETYCVIGVIARMEQGKGHEYIIKAIPEILRRQKNVIFLFVGEGSLMPELVAMVEKESFASHVIFTGLRDDVSEILQICDIFCLASYYEGMGRVVLEAQAAGIPVVATYVGGIPDIVIKDKTAILIRPNHSASISKAILQLLEDKNLRNQMAEAASNFVDERFSSRKMMEQVISLYNNCIIC